MLPFIAASHKSLGFKPASERNEKMEMMRPSHLSFNSWFLVTCRRSCEHIWISSKILSGVAAMSLGFFAGKCMAFISALLLASAAGISLLVVSARGLCRESQLFCI
jgi:hypothetical protein